jgi:hypothetical protein
VSPRGGAGGRYSGGDGGMGSSGLPAAASRAESKANPLYMKAVVMVDEATEPGIGDDDGERRRVALVELVQSGGDPRHGNAAENSPGAAVAYAIRKRLKSDDHVAVLNCLTLLDETVRTCPYFYRYIANDKFFRRMWRFVDPGTLKRGGGGFAEAFFYGSAVGGGVSNVFGFGFVLCFCLSSRVQVGPAGEAAVFEREQGKQDGGLDALGGGEY